MRRGEIWWADLPTIGRRPVLIMTRDPAIPVLKRIVVVPATRTIRGIGSEVPLGRPDGMPADCVLAFDNIRAVSKAYLTHRITELGSTRMAEVCRALNYAMACG